MAASSSTAATTARSYIFATFVGLSNESGNEEVSDIPAAGAGGGPMEPMVGTAD